MLGQCWASVIDGEPTLVQHWVAVSCLLRWYLDHLPTTSVDYLLLSAWLKRPSRREHWHLKWMSDELHLTLRRNRKACHETSNVRRRWPYFQTPMSFKPVYKIRILPQRSQTILHISIYYYSSLYYIYHILTYYK